MTMRFHAVRVFVLGVKALVRYWLILRTRLACFSWNLKMSKLRSRPKGITQQARHLAGLVDEMGQVPSQNQYKRRRIAYDMMQALNNLHDSKTMTKYRIGSNPNGRARDRALVNLLLARYYK